MKTTVKEANETLTLEQVINKYGLEMHVLGGPVPHNKDNWQALEYIVQITKVSGGHNKEVWKGSYKIGKGHVKHNYKRIGFGCDFTHNERNMFNAWQNKPNAQFVDKDLFLSMLCKVAKQQEITPNFDDVLYSIIMDSEVLDYSCFEEWAECVGYDTDSRLAEEVYKTCLKCALTLRKNLGDTAINELREALQDY